MKTYTTIAGQKWVNDPDGDYPACIYRDLGMSDSSGHPILSLVADCSGGNSSSDDERRDVVAAITAAPKMLAAIEMNLRLLEHVADQYDLDEDDQASLDTAIKQFRNALGDATAE
ncbi:MAG: hypothetical protein F8N15_00375 [Methanobacterium sp.]|nr:hypothetical protein [Methanobacterium sp.]